jgi:hypothetical protein
MQRIFVIGLVVMAGCLEGSSTNDKLVFGEAGPDGPAPSQSPPPQTAAPPASSPSQPPAGAKQYPVEIPKPNLEGVQISSWLPDGVKVWGKVTFKDKTSQTFGPFSTGYNPDTFGNNVQGTDSAKSGTHGPVTGFALIPQPDQAGQVATTWIVVRDPSDPENTGPIDKGFTGPYLNIAVVPAPPPGTPPATIRTPATPLEPPPPQAPPQQPIPNNRT